MKSKQEKAKQAQGYRKELSKCSNCEHFECDVEVHRSGYEEKKKLRCGIGGFKVMQSSVCNLWESAKWIQK